MCATWNKKHVEVMSIAFFYSSITSISDPFKNPLTAIQPLFCSNLRFYIQFLNRVRDPEHTYGLVLIQRFKAKTTVTMPIFKEYFFYSKELVLPQKSSTKHKKYWEKNVDLDSMTFSPHDSRKYFPRGCVTCILFRIKIKTIFDLTEKYISIL